MINTIGAQHSTYAVHVSDALALVERNILLVIDTLNLDQGGVVLLVHLGAANENQTSSSVSRLQIQYKPEWRDSLQTHACNLQEY